MTSEIYNPDDNPDLADIVLKLNATISVRDP